MAYNFPLSKSLPLSSVLLPYYGLVDECAYMMQRLCKKSRKLWQCNEEILMRIINNKRILNLNMYSEEAIALVDVKKLKYFVIEIEEIESFLTKMFNNKLNEVNSCVGNSDSLFMDTNDSNETTSSPKNKLVNYSCCPDLVHIKSITLNLNDTELISSYLDELESFRLCAQGYSFQERILFNGSANTIYIPYFDLKDNTDMEMFHSIQRRIQASKVGVN